jgi:hypothetical protein
MYVLCGVDKGDVVIRQEGKSLWPYSEMTVNPPT